MSLVSWEDALQRVVKKYYRAALVPPPTWTTGEGVARHTVRNRACGDAVEVWFDEASRRVWLHSVGCAICHASTALAREVSENLTVDELLRVSERIVESLSSGGQLLAFDMFDGEHTVLREEITALCALRESPARYRCASLPWEALTECLR